MIQEQYISFEVAKLLKNRDDFHVSSKSHYNAEGNLYFTSMSHYNLTAGDGCIAPTQQLVMRWLREVHDVYIDISSRFSKNADKDVCFSYSCKKLIDIYKSSYEVGDGEWLNYEDAVEAAIKYCLTNLI